MQIRSWVWGVFILTCIGILTFALLRPSHAPATLQVHIDQSPSARETLTLKLFLSDMEQVPISDAHIQSRAYMTNMVMPGDAPQIRRVGSGHYLATFHFSMAGPWAIEIKTYADGFAPIQQTLFLHVQ
jgi:YtkA-like